MSMSSNAYKRLCVLYRNVLQHMRELNHRLLVGFEGRVKAMSSGQAPLEQLEPRLMMDAFFWAGYGVDGSWSDGNNWDGGIAPSAGDDLYFESGEQMDTFNGFTDGRSFSSINILGSGFTFGGYQVGVSGVLYTTTVTTMDLPIAFAASSSINNNQYLNLRGVVTGTVSKSGSGLLELSGSSENTGLQLV